MECLQCNVLCGYRVPSVGSFILLKYYFHLLINDFNITKKIRKTPQLNSVL